MFCFVFERKIARKSKDKAQLAHTSSLYHIFIWEDEHFILEQFIECGMSLEQNIECKIIRYQRTVRFMNEH